MITDEMVEKAAQAFMDSTDAGLPDVEHGIRAALEAVAMTSDEMVEKAVEYFGRDHILKSVLDTMTPQLIAAGMREAAKIAMPHGVVEQRILARAQELDPQPELRGQSFEEPYPEMITDEMVDKARDAYLDGTAITIETRIRLALEAIAPALIAQGMREAAIVVLTLPPKGEPELAHCQINRACDAVLSRAQELDPK